MLRWAAGVRREGQKRILRAGNSKAGPNKAAAACQNEFDMDRRRRRRLIFKFLVASAIAHMAEERR